MKTSYDKELFQELLTDKSRYLLLVCDKEVMVMDKSLPLHHPSHCRSFDEFGHRLLSQLLQELGFKVIEKQ